MNGKKCNRCGLVACDDMINYGRCDVTNATKAINSIQDGINSLKGYTINKKNQAETIRWLWLSIGCLLLIIVFFTYITSMQENTIRKQDQQYHELVDQYRKLLKDHKRVIEEMNKLKLKNK
jgi:type II secretory pathway component PulL